MSWRFVLHCEGCGDLWRNGTTRGQQVPIREYDRAAKEDGWTVWSGPKRERLDYCAECTEIARGGVGTTVEYAPRERR